MKPITRERKILTGIIAAAGIVVSAAGWAALEGVLMWHDNTYVTVASQNKSLQFEIEDELYLINQRIENGTATAQDMERKAVLEDRLKHI
jgi:hypothetical protein